MQDSRDALLAATLDVIQDRGLSRLSLREVARRAGVSHQLPYHWFKNKEGLLAALVGQGFAALLNEMRSIPCDDDAASSLASLGTVYVRFASENRALYSMMFRPDVVDLHDHPEAEAVATEVMDCLADAVTKVHAAGTAQHLSEPALVHLAWSAVHGAAMLLTEGAYSDQAVQRAMQVPYSLAAALRGR